MNLVRRAAQQLAGAGLSIADLDRTLDAMYGGGPTYTGKLVSQNTAMQVSSVWACVGVLANDIATAPFLTYYLLDNGRELAKDHYLWSLLLEEANPELTSWRWKHLMQVWALLWGNAYAELELNGRGQISAIWPWRPDRVTISRDSQNRLQYTYKNAKGQKFTVPQDRMFHLRGMSMDGITGLSPIEYHKQTIGLSMAVIEHGARFFSNGARPLGIVSHPASLGDKAYDRLKEDWKSEHEGLSNAHRVAILEEGMQWTDTGFNMVDAQYLEVIGATRSDIARIYNVPLHRIADLSSSTNNNIEHQGLEYVQYSIGTWAENWSQEICFSMLSQCERQTVSVKANFNHLLRGDHAAMGEFISKMINNHVLNPDEVREEFLDRNPQAGGVGKKYWAPSNTMPIQADGSIPVQQPLTNLPPDKAAPKPNGLAH